MTYTPEIETVTRYRFLGTTYTTMEEALKARAFDILGEEIGTTPLDAIRLNPRHVIAVVSAYADELDRINGTAQQPPLIDAHYFVQPTMTDRWPFQAKSPSHIANWSDMCIEIDRLWSNRDKIPAIRVLRQCFGAIEPGLKEAKNWIEARHF